MGRTQRPGAAVAMVLGAMALFGLIDNFMRLAAATGGLWQFHFLRGLLAVALLWPVVRMQGGSFRPRRPGAVLLRSVFNSLAMVLYFGALGFLPIAQALAGLFTAPLFVVLFSVVIFGDGIGPRRIVAVALGFAGVVLALGLDAGGLGLSALVPVVAGACYGMGNLLTRRTCAEESTFTLLGWFFALMAFWGALGCIVLALLPQEVAAGAAGWVTRGWVLPQGWFLVLIVVQAVGSLIGVGMTIRAYQIAADPTVIAVLENALLLFATLWAIVLWSEAPGPAGWAGLGLIVAAGVMIARRGAGPVPRHPDLPE